MHCTVLVGLCGCYVQSGIDILCVSICVCLCPCLFLLLSFTVKSYLYFCMRLWHCIKVYLLYSVRQVRAVLRCEGKWRWENVSQVLRRCYWRNTMQSRAQQRLYQRNMSGAPHVKIIVLRRIRNNNQLLTSLYFCQNEPNWQLAESLA